MFLKDNHHKKIFLQKHQSPQKIPKPKNDIHQLPQLPNQHTNFNNSIRYQSPPHKLIKHIQSLTTNRIVSDALQNQLLTREQTYRYKKSQIISDTKKLSYSSASKKQLSKQKASFQIQKNINNGANIQVRLPTWQYRSDRIYSEKQSERVYRQMPKNQSVDKGLQNFLKKIEENKKIIRNQINNRKEKNNEQQRYSTSKKKMAGESTNVKLQIENVSLKNKIKYVQQALKNLKAKNNSTKNENVGFKIKVKKEKVSTEPSSSEQFQPIKQTYFKSNKQKKSVKAIEQNRKNLTQNKEQQKHSKHQKNHHNYSFQDELERMNDFMEKGSSSLEKYVKLACMYQDPKLRQQNVHSLLVYRRQSYKRLAEKSKKFY